MRVGVVGEINPGNMADSFGFYNVGTGCHPGAGLVRPASMRNGGTWTQIVTDAQDIVRSGWDGDILIPHGGMAENEPAVGAGVVDGGVSQRNPPERQRWSSPMGICYAWVR